MNYYTNRNGKKKLAIKCKSWAEKNFLIENHIKKLIKFMKAFM